MPEVYADDQKPDTLRKIAELLVESADEVKALAEKVETLKLGEISVKGSDQMTRALKYLNAFVANTNRSIRDARVDRGDYRAGGPNKLAELSKKKQGPKKKKGVSDSEK